jgi:hypothetical protein
VGLSALNRTRPDMKPIFDARSEWQRDLGRRGLAILSVLIGLGVAQADTTGFTGEFAAAFWTNSPAGFGSASITNSGAALVLAGPTGTPPSGSSFDGMQYNEALGGGLVVGGTVQFHWDYRTSEDVTGNTGATLSYTPEGNGGSVQYSLGQGVIPTSGDFSESVEPGSTFSFLLETETPSGKPLGDLSTVLTISNFRFVDVPEPSTGTLMAIAVISLFAARWRCGRRRASGPL